MSQKVKPWHDRHRRPRNKGKRPRHNHNLSYDKQREDYTEPVWINPARDDLTDGSIKDHT